MMLRSIWFQVLYVAVLGLCIIGALDYRWEGLHLVFKPLIMFSLGLGVRIDLKGRGGSMKTALLIAITTSLLGDVALMLDQIAQHLLIGLGCFFVAHAAYIYCFTRLPGRPLEVTNIRKHPWVIFVLILYAGWFFLEVRSGAGDIAWAVLLYILVIMAMALAAFNRSGAVPAASYRWVFAGAVLFLVSDSILAWDLFKKQIDMAPLWVLGTYGLAQYAIARGLVQQELEPL